MAGGYMGAPAEGIKWIVDKFKDIDRQFSELRGSAGILSAKIGRGGITVTDGGEIVAEGGNIRAVDAVTKNALAFFGKLRTPYKSGLLTATEDGVPFFWAAVLEDDTRRLNFTGESYSVTSDASISGGETYRVDATDNIILNTPSLRLYGLATSGLAPNLVLDTAGGTPVLKLVTSSERNKSDIAPIEIDVADVLAYQGITWVHDDPDSPLPEGDVRRNVGHHAEAMDQFPSLRQFVNYDDDGQPESVQEGRFEVALLEVVKALWVRVNDHDARLDALESQ